MRSEFCEEAGERSVYSGSSSSSSSSSSSMIVNFYPNAP